MKPKILIIGSVHIDVVAKYHDRTKDSFDKQGDISFSIGGVAYNIAANLAVTGYEVSLFSVVKENSISAGAIKDRLSVLDINHEYIQYDLHIGESGYSSLSNNSPNGRYTAISSMCIEEKAFEGELRKRLQKAISEHDLVAVDTNLSAEQIKVVIKDCKKSNRVLFASNASDSKAGRIVESIDGFDGYVFDLLALNEVELERIRVILGKNLLDDPCQALKSNIVVVTMGEKGYLVYVANSKEIIEKNIEFERSKIETDLGAGDALFSAVCAHQLKNKVIVWDKCHGTIREYVSRVLRCKGATPEGNIVNINNRKGMIRIDRLRSFLMVFFLALPVFLAITAFFSPELSGESFGRLFFIISITAGVSGTLFRDLVSNRSSRRHSTTVDVALGAVAGLFSCLLFLLTHWVTLQDQFLKVLDPQGPSETFPITLKFLLLISALISFSAGIYVDTALQSWRKERIEKVSNKAIG